MPEKTYIVRSSNNETVTVRASTITEALDKAQPLMRFAAVDITEVSEEGVTEE